jgi:hypothetical protein
MSHVYYNKFYMIRTHVYLTEGQSQAIKLRSRRDQKPEAEVLRDIVDKGLAVEGSTAKMSTGQSLLQLVELGKKYGAHGPTDLSTNLDDYLYGNKA